MTNENEFAPPIKSETKIATAQVEQSRSIAEVQAAVVLAKQFPRDKFTAVNMILKDCERFTLAEKATYAYPRGGQTVKGASIRLAESIAQAWGNLDYGVRELEQHDGFSEMQAYCWDLETNVRSTINFTVKHERHTKQGKRVLTDPRDIYEMTANQASRRVRSRILAIIPGDVIEKALGKCEATIKNGNGIPFEDRVQTMVRAFSSFGIGVLDIEKKLGHPLKNMDADELADMISIGNSIKDNHKNKYEFFDLKSGAEQSESAKELTKKLEQETNAKKEPKKKKEENKDKDANW